MNDYLVVYYKGSQPTFAYAESIESAFANALSMTAGKKNKEDVLSIVEVATDTVLYYGKGEGMSDSLRANVRPKKDNQFAHYSVLQSFMNWIGSGLKLVKSSN